MSATEDIQAELRGTHHLVYRAIIELADRLDFIEKAIGTRETSVDGRKSTRVSITQPCAIPTFVEGDYPDGKL